MCKLNESGYERLDAYNAMISKIGFGSCLDSWIKLWTRINDRAVPTLLCFIMILFHCSFHLRNYIYPLYLVRSRTQDTRLI